MKATFEQKQVCGVLLFSYSIEYPNRVPYPLEGLMNLLASDNWVRSPISFTWTPPLLLMILYISFWFITLETIDYALMIRGNN